jgi:hypothetical protein
MLTTELTSITCISVMTSFKMTTAAAAVATAAAAAADIPQAFIFCSYLHAPSRCRNVRFKCHDRFIIVITRGKSFT